MNAALDVMLTKQLNAGKLFVGQKLRVSYFPARFNYFVWQYIFLVRSLIYTACLRFYLLSEDPRCRTFWLGYPNITS